MLFILFLSSLLINNIYGQFPDSSNKEFWDRLNINSYSAPKLTYNTYLGQGVCMSCPVDRNLYRSLLAKGKSQIRKQLGDHYTGETPDKLVIRWSSLINGQFTPLCANNTKSTKNTIFLNYGRKFDLEPTNLDYTCENERLCIWKVKNFYPKSYSCSIDNNNFEITSNTLIDFKSLLSDWVNKYSI